MERKLLIIQDSNINNFSNYYEEFINRSFPFRDYVLGDIDTNVLIYYRFCVKENHDINEIFKHLKTTQSKDEFIKYANKIIEDAKVKSLKEQIQETNLVCYLSSDNFSKDKIKQIVEYINFLKKENYGNIEVSILRQEKGFDKEELLNLLNLQEILQQNIYVVEKNGDSDITLNQTIEAYDKMEKEIEKIKELDLSPFEQFLYVHDFAANKIYKKYKGNWFHDSGKCRSFVSTMTSDYIVCVGYANIVRTFCERLGIECMLLEGDPKREHAWDERGIGHAANIVKIIDEKYGIDGYYFCDACWDSRRSTEETTKNYFYSALPMQDIANVGQSKYFSHEVDYLRLVKQSVPISMLVFKEALTSLYSKIEKEQFNKQTVVNNLKYSIQFSYNHCNIKSENDFMRTYLEQRKKEGQYTF